MVVLMRQLKESRVEFNRFEKRRRYPRIVLDRTVNLFLPGNQPVSVLLHDLSECAIQARFNAETEETIRLALQLANTDDEYVLGIRFRIKLHYTEEEIFVSCNPICICQLDTDLFAMGLQFQDMENKYRRLIQKFVEVSLEPL